MIEDVLKTHKNLHSCLLPFYNTERGKEFVTGLQEAFQRTFPQYHDELEAIATGAKVPHIQVSQYFKIYTITLFQLLALLIMQHCM